MLLPLWQMVYLLNKYYSMADVIALVADGITTIIHVTYMADVIAKVAWML